MTQRIDFVSRDGQPMTGELSLPAGSARGPAVVVVHEWWGLNDDMRRICERFAADGIVALAVDLFGGRVTTDEQVALKLVTEMKTLDAMEIIGGAVERLSSHARSDGRVFVTGFCVGGAMALAAACNVEGLAGVIPFYGVPKAEYADWSKRTCPVLGHYGRKDDGIPVAKVEALEAAIRAGSPAPVSIHYYEAGHAFMREPDPAKFDERAAKLAWTRSVELMRA